ncbi:hypothetical protein KFZ56_08770 [Virgibacillus sp. NKC19-3]|uniref:MFS transporter n=1 Tax=Virgibacillus saliphilus TaxID=2831674 RepID=UPI001C9ACEB3|nr:MFS transporter [Virgibacillus sp. NKC19-3]MBY7143148.1 hypothetical protein [Virgibacillus sp. NKC19-3]
MAKNKYDPIKHSNRHTERDKRLFFLLFLVFGLVALLLIVFGIYIVIVDSGLWALLILFLVIAAPMIFFALAFYPRQREVVYSYELNDNGLYQHWEYTKTGKEKEIYTPFEDMDKVLIGHLPTRIPVHKGRDYFRFDARLILMYQGNYFVQDFYPMDDPNQWIDRFADAGIPIRYTNYDLFSAFITAYYIEVDFYEMESIPWDFTGDQLRLGEESHRNPFPKWISEEGEEKIKTVKEDIKVPKTRRAEKLTLWMLFVFAVFFGSVMMPGMPLDEDGVVSFGEALFTAIIINALIPFVFVYWRSYTKWYNPILYFIVVSIGNCLGLFIVSLFRDIPNLYGSIFIMNIFNLFLWATLLIFVKGIKFIGDYKRKHNL